MSRRKGPKKQYPKKHFDTPKKDKTRFYKDSRYKSYRADKLDKVKKINKVNKKIVKELSQDRDGRSVEVEDDFYSQCGMTCKPTCLYFNCCEHPEFEKDEEGVKHVKESSFICGYDGHKITSWYDKCPKALGLIIEDN